MLIETLKDSYKNSIILRTLMGFSLIIGFNLLTMLGSMYLAESIGGDAEAINRAGSLRMQSYRLSVHLAHVDESAASAQRAQLELLLEEFERTLNMHSLRRAIGDGGNERLNLLYAQAKQRWSSLMRPLLEQDPPQYQAFNGEVALFVTLLDEFVHELQIVSERKLSYIRAFQVGSLFITVLTAFVITISSHNKLVVPLQKLVAFARRIGKGDFSGQTSLTGDYELGLLGRTLNTMSQELSELYQNLENKVQTKTEELRRSNASLTLLFRVAQRLYKTTDDPVPAIAQLLHEIRHTLGVECVSICLFSQSADSAQAHTVLSTAAEGRPAHCQGNHQCGGCLLHQSKTRCSHASFTIKTESSIFGTLHVQTESGQTLQVWQQQIFTTLTDFFAVALNLNKLGSRQARIALMEERAVIARELHDSLAQALSYQKIQLALLKKQLLAQAPQETVQTTIEEIQDGLSSAYRHLRELLSTFRMKLDVCGLAPGIRSAMQEFSRLASVRLELDYQLQHCPLTPNEEIHCLQIAREAISNVIKHANAKECRVILRQDVQGEVHLSIEDDGIGFNPAGRYSGHYGLQILKERAQSLSGRIEITPLVPGTRVHVCFTPAYITQTHHHQ